MSKITYEKLYRKSSFHSATSILKLECHFFIFFFFQIMWQETGRALKTQKVIHWRISFQHRSSMFTWAEGTEKAPPVHNKQFKHSFWPLHKPLVGSWPFSVSLSIHCVSFYKTSIRSSIRKGSTCPPDLLFSTEGKGRAFKRQLEAR